MFNTELRRTSQQGNRVRDFHTSEVSCKTNKSYRWEYRRGSIVGVYSTIDGFRINVCQDRLTHNFG